MNFTKLEFCQMKNCPCIRFFKLKCQLWRSDWGLFGGDDFVYTSPTVRYYPDTTSLPSDDAEFDETLGEGALDEDCGRRGIRYTHSYYLSKFGNSYKEYK